MIGLGFCGPCTFRGSWWFTFMLVVVVYFSVQEYDHLLQQILQPPLVPTMRWLHLVISVSVVVAAQLGILTGIFECAAVSLLSLLMILQGNKKQPDGSPPITFSHLSSQVFGVFYTGYLPAFWVRLRGIKIPLAVQPSGFLTGLLGLLHWRWEPTVGCCAATSCALCIIAADTCAYAGGKRWGKTRLIRISPGKTVEGLWCGFAGSVLMAILLDAAWGFPAHIGIAALTGAVICFASLLGDLTVSAMKRDAGLKDAGAMIPGHGGVLDRFDSWFFTGAAVYFCWWLYLKARGMGIRIPQP